MSRGGGSGGVGRGERGQAADFKGICNSAKLLFYITGFSWQKLVAVIKLYFLVLAFRRRKSPGHDEYFIFRICGLFSFNKLLVRTTIKAIPWARHCPKGNRFFAI